MREMRDTSTSLGVSDGGAVGTSIVGAGFTSNVWLTP